MRRTILSILLVMMALPLMANVMGDSIAGTTPSRINYVDSAYRKGTWQQVSVDDRKQFIKHLQDSINALPFDTTRDKDYWRRAIVNGEWSFFTDPTAKKPGLLNLAYKAYKFYSKAFNNYDTAYVVGISKDFKVMFINNNWLDSYGGMIADKDMKVFMHSDINSSVGLHFSYMGIGYTYMFDLDNVFGGDPTRHAKWEMSFATSRFSFEAYHSRNTGLVTIERFGDYNNKRRAINDFGGLSQRTWGFDTYYFFNHRKYSQAAAYSYSKIQKRSAGSFIAGFLVSTQNVDVDFTTLPDDMKDYLPDGGERLYYKYHHRSYCFLLGYAYNWVFNPKWLFNVTVAPSIGWNHSFDDSVDGKRDMPAVDLRGRLGLVYNIRNFFFGLQFVIDAHLYHSKYHNFINSQEDLTFNAGFRF